MKSRRPALPVVVDTTRFAFGRSLEVCARCFGLGVIETTQSIGVPPSCEDCGGRGYVVSPALELVNRHATQCAAPGATASSEKTGERFAQDVHPDDPLVCASCQHRRLNRDQAIACCTMQGSPCPTCIDVVFGGSR